MSYPNFLYTFISPILTLGCCLARLHLFWIFVLLFVLFGDFYLSLLPVSSPNFLYTFITLINFTPWFFLIMQNCMCFESLLFYLFCFKCSTSYTLRVYFDSLCLRKTLLDDWILSVHPCISSFSPIYQAIFNYFFLFNLLKEYLKWGSVTQGFLGTWGSYLVWEFEDIMLFRSCGASKKILEVFPYLVRKRIRFPYFSLPGVIFQCNAQWYLGNNSAESQTMTGPVQDMILFY